MTQTTVVADLQARIAELEAKNKELTQALADLDKWICIAEQLDFLLDEYGRSTEPMTPKAEEVRDWMQVHVINPQERITELEKLAVAWHRYPDERPTVNTHENCSRVLKDFLVVCCGGVVAIGNYVTYPTTFWNKQNVTHWAELPAPLEEK